MIPFSETDSAKGWTERKEGSEIEGATLPSVKQVNIWPETDSTL